MSRRMVRCLQGHPFDASANEVCPICAAREAKGGVTPAKMPASGGVHGEQAPPPPAPWQKSPLVWTVAGIVVLGAIVYVLQPKAVPPAAPELQKQASTDRSAPPPEATPAPQSTPRPVPVSPANPAPVVVPTQASTPLERVEAMVAAMKALRAAPLPAGFSAWTGGRAPVAADLPDGAKTLLQIGGIGKDALGTYLRMEASRTSTPTTKVKLLEQAFVLGEAPAAALEIAEILKISDPARAFAFAREAGDRGVVAGDRLAVALAGANPAAFPLPDAVRQRFYERSNASVKDAGAGLDTSALPEPTDVLCGRVRNGDTAAITEAGTRGSKGDLEAAGCFTAALLVDFSNLPQSGVPATPARPNAALAREVISRLTPSSDRQPGFIDAMAGDFALGANGGDVNPVEAAIWFLRAASLAPDVSLPSNEAPAVARYAEAMATLRPPTSDAVAVVLDPLRAAIIEPAPAPKTAKRLDIGIAAFPVPSKLASDNGLTTGQGALVGRFVRGSTAEAQGLLVGDIVTAVNGRPVENADNLSTLVEQTTNGKPVLDFIRNGQRRTLQILAAAVQVAPSGPAQPAPPAQARNKPVAPGSADPVCWSDTLSLAEKRSRGCLTAEAKTGPGSSLAVLDDLPYLRISCCDGLTPRFTEVQLPGDPPEDLARRWVAWMPDRSILLVDGYTSAAAAQQAASYAQSTADPAARSASSVRYQRALIALDDHTVPAQAKIDSTIVTVESGKYPLPSGSGNLQLYTRCFFMMVSRPYVLCNAHLPGTVAVVTYVRQTKATDSKVTSGPMQLLSALLAEGMINGSLPASPPP